MTESVEAPRRVRWGLGAVGVSVLGGVVTALVTGWCPAGAIVVGPLRHVWWLSTLVASICIVSGAAVVVRHRARLRGMQWFGAVAALGGQCTVVLAIAVASWFAISGVVFLEYRIDTLRLPDGRVAHLTRGGFLCGYRVYTSRWWQVFATRISSTSRKSCREDARLALGPDGAPRVLSPTGDALRSDTEPFVIDLFPH